MIADLRKMCLATKTSTFLKSSGALTRHQLNGCGNVALADTLLRARTAGGANSRNQREVLAGRFEAIGESLQLIEDTPFLGLAKHTESTAKSPWRPAVSAFDGLSIS